MRNEIRWEHEKKHGGRVSRPQIRGGWCDCLLLFCGTLFCLFSAYRQLSELLDGMGGLALPVHAWRYVLSAAVVLSVCYGSGVLRRVWMRALVLLPMAIVFSRYYLAHRIQTEDGILYVMRMYVAQICRYYDCSIVFPVGVEEEAPAALLFWMLLLFLGLFVLAATVRCMELMLVLPLAMLFAGIAVGKTSGWQSIVLLFAGALVLRMYRKPFWERASVRMAQLVSMFAICALAGVALSGLADDVIDRHEEMMKRQLALEDAVLALPVWDLFVKDGTVTNDPPRGSGKEVLTITLSDAATENVYLKSYAADHYENGRWTASETAFAQAAQAQGLTVQDAGKRIQNLPCEEGAHALEPSDEWDPMVNMDVEEPKEYDYTITCSHFGKAAPLPYVSSLPEDLTMKGDVAAEKPWTKKSYGGSLTMGDSATDSLTDYLANYYWTDTWVGMMTSISDLDAQTDTESAWYADLVWEQYTGASESTAAEQWLDDCLRLVGWESSAKIREYFSYLRGQEYASTINMYRLNYVSWVQMLIQDFGSYNRSLDPLPSETDPIDYFLNTSREGYCVHFASAATLMLQGMGIPARYASGYVVFPNDFKKTEEGYTAVVTDARAHAWVEVYVEEFGWVPYEVTPGFNVGDSEASTQLGKQDTPESGQNGQKPENQADQPPQADKETLEAPQNRTDTGAGVSGTAGMDIRTWLTDTTCLGLALIWWMWIFLLLLGVYVAVRLIVRLRSDYEWRQEWLWQEEMRDENYREAINRINRRMYRLLAARELLVGRKIRDDKRYRRALGWLSAFHEAAVDADLYMELVRQAHFSDTQMCAEDAWTVYEIYQRCRRSRREREKMTWNSRRN